MPTSLEAHHIVKRYGGVVALADGSLNVRSGEVVALLGANGSGKSTLIKVLTGVVAANGGQLRLDENPVEFPNPWAARRQGITAVYQDLSLIPDMSIAENIWLTHEPRRYGLLDKSELRRRTRDLLALFGDTYDEGITPDSRVDTLPPDVRQLVEILKAYSQDPRVIILDEATASLDSQQVQRLFELVERWKTEGMAIVFVSHRMDEIFRVADRVVILRNGVTVGGGAIGEMSEKEMIDLMVEGAAPPQLEHDLQLIADTPIRLRVQNLRTDKLHGVDLVLHDGELLGIGGLQGQGQNALLLALFGAIPYEGTVELNGDACNFNHPAEAIEKGIAFVPGDRASEGLLLGRSILENLQLPSWEKYGRWLDLHSAQTDAAGVADSLSLVRASLQAPVSSLSGGNAQKVVIGKWLLRQPQLLLLNDPTKGIDVGAKGEFYELLIELRRRNTAILFYSSDDEELLSLCDRVLILHDGMISAELADDTLDSGHLVAASLGRMAHYADNAKSNKVT